MIKYVIKRILLLIPVFLGVTFVIFAIVRLNPADPVVAILGINITDEQYAAKAAELGLDQPFFVQYLLYIKNIVFNFDLGVSYSTGRQVSTMIAERFGTTLQLGLMGIALALVLGIPFGIISATRQYSLVDRVVTFGSLVFASMPAFFSALVMMLLFSLKLRWLPASFDQSFLGWIMPVVAVGMSPVAGITRMTRSSMLDVIRQDYVRTARAKGLAEKVIIFKHELKNAVIPVLTVVGMQIGSIMAGSVVVESIFSVPGMGSMISQAITDQDYNLVQGSVLFIALFICAINLVVDIVYAFIDPRIKAQYKGGGKKKNRHQEKEKGKVS